MNIRILLLSALLIQTGCTVGPDYVKPEVDTPADWRTTLVHGQQAANLDWWRQFDDPVLDQLVQTALDNNYDLQIAVARVAEFAARVDIARAGRYPQLGYGGDATRSATTIPSRIGNNFQATLNVGWELDFWGRIRRATEAARAQLLASEYGRYSVVLTLVSTTATSYVTLRNLDRQLQIANETLERRAESVALFETQFEGGVISALEVAQIKSEYEAAAVTIPAIEEQITLLENALSALLGQNPGTITRGKSIDELILPSVPAGIPADILLHRPDVLQAEQNLIAANAQIGIARAEYFPNISLTGLLGLASGDLSDLLDSASKVWAIGGNLSGPLFTGGRLDAQLEVSEAIQQQALNIYLQTVQTAFTEVDNALTSTEKTRQQLSARGRQVSALKDYARLAKIRYDEGYVSYIEVLDSERLLFDAELEYTRAQSNVYTALISIYKAMGGGWEIKEQSK